MANKSYSTVPFEIKDADPVKGVISGYAAVFNNIDDGLDRIRHGAFTKTLQERSQRIKACYGHDLLKIVGVPIEVREDDHGLYTVTQLALGSLWGKEVYELAMTQGPDGQRALDEMSIGYVPIVANYDPTNGIRDLSELKLYEYSYVPLGMNDQTRGLDVKSLLDGLPKAERSTRLLAFLDECKSLAINEADYITGVAAIRAALTEPDAAQAGAPLTEARDLDLWLRRHHIAVAR